MTRPALELASFKPTVGNDRVSIPRHQGCFKRRAKMPQGTMPRLMAKIPLANWLGVFVVRPGPADSLGTLAKVAKTPALARNLGVRVRLRGYIGEAQLLL